jgi:two-component sensor histidine kinase
VLEDHAGEWWIATGSGLYRFPSVSRFDRLARTPPKAVYTPRDGLASSEILSLFEDSRGDLWVGQANPSGLSRWQRAGESFRHYTESDGLPSLLDSYPISFVEDRAGGLWIGFSIGGGLVRYRDGRFTRFTSAEGLPEGGIFSLFVDSMGRLWVPTTRGGVCRIDHPETERPALMTYTTGDGLSSNDVRAITEDGEGRIYLGTGRGIDRLDAASGHLRHYTTNEGALLGDVQAALRDRDGALWFSYMTGLVRLVPEPFVPSAAPTVLITGLRIAGDAQAVSALGETEIAPVELVADRNQMQIDFVALGFSPGEGLRYQYRLDGAGQDWSPPSEQRSVNFARLAPGRYRFLVRAINADGAMSEQPASFQFTILSPLWQRWWFLAAAAVLLGLALYWLYRYQLAQRVKVERVRTRIATDLHDDIGANLSLIAMASEVARHRARSDDRQMAEALSLISGTSRELVDSMGDLVWAVNPERDHLADLLKRMRRFASDVFSARGIAFRFHAPSDDHDIRLGTETRREVLLIFKEAINNIARHSQCASAEVELMAQGGWLTLKLSDNGRGFDTTRSFDGNGLVSMRQRAARLDGTLVVASRRGEGTTLTLKAPLK